MLGGENTDSYDEFEDTRATSEILGASDELRLYEKYREEGSEYASQLAPTEQMMQGADGAEYGYFDPQQPLSAEYPDPHNEYTYPENSYTKQCKSGTKNYLRI